MTIKVGLLVCDTPMDSLKEVYGDYVLMFSRLLPSVEITPFDCLDMKYPSDPTLFDAFVITGARYSAYDKDPWIQQLLAFIQKVDALGVKMVGICFGHQAITMALGGNVTKNEKGWEIGYININFNETGKQLLKPLNDSMGILSMHQDHVTTIPPGFQVLATTEKSHVQMMVKPQKYLTIQAHPEFTAGYCQGLIDHREKVGIFSSELVKSLEDINQIIEQSWYTKIITDFILEKSN
ncbi:class I glutamine amidotransferase-like protein [Globomyces pollinis-pini]|nr:class I glutamine amidotransferase-like protein [Globomyces pollinis-pini]